MKALKYILSTVIFCALVWSCEDNEFGETDFVDNIEAPSNVAASVSITQDNTGLVTITPTSNGAVSYTVDFGDSSDIEEGISTGNSISHYYAEGTFQATITAVGINGLSTSVVEEIVVSFNAPENLVVTIVNDEAVSKQVNVTATADYATSYEVYFGESTDETPLTFGVDETISYQYTEAGTYTITVIAMSAAIETLSYSEEFLVTAILQPVVAVATPTSLAANVISVFSDAYTDPDPIDYNPNWGQSTTYTQIEVEGDNIIQYGGLTYQGIDFNTAPIDASEMEFIHVDIWTADEDFDAKISPISAGPFEAAYDLELTANEWTSFDIPISYFTEANASLDFSNIIQFKFDGVDSGAGSIFVDNLYFYKTQVEQSMPTIPVDFESSELDYGMFSFGGPSFEAIPVAIIDNPDASGINVSSKVFEIEKTSGSQVWAGAGIILEGGVDFSEGTTITVDVWSPTAGTPILFKMEDSSSASDANGNPSVVVEVEVSTTVANQWETLSFDLTSFEAFSTSNSYDNVILFPNFNNSGTGSTYYFDNIMLTN